MDETTESREDRLVREIRESRGWILPEQEYLARNDYEFYVRHNAKAAHIRSSERVLPLKVVELLYIVALCIRLPAEESQTYIRNHIRQAFAHGASEREILEAIEMTVFPGGSPSMNAGIKALCAVLEERGAA